MSCNNFLDGSTRTVALVGHGVVQFGEVMLRIEPLERGAGFEFLDVAKSGVIAGVFMVAVEKSVR